MHPLLLTGIVGIGKAVLNNVFPSQTAKVADVAQKVGDFASVLKGNSVPKTQSGLETYLSQNNVSDVSQMNQLRRQLTNQLLSHPNLQAHLAGAKEIHLNLQDGANFSVTTDQGKTINLASPELSLLAQRIHDMSSISQFNSALPGNSLRDLISQVSQNPQLTANWTIRQPTGLIA